MQKQYLDFLRWLLKDQPYVALAYMTGILPASGKPALVVELKYDGCAEGAIEQIKEKQYTQALEDYTGEILLVGINYDKDGGDKAHSCVIERFVRNQIKDNCESRKTIKRGETR